LLKKIFTDKSLLTLALTHRSWLNENKNIRNSNERLEFLGDAVLEFVISLELYNRFPHKEEGYLTALRANLVNTQNLADVARKLKLGEEIYLSKGEEEGGGRNNNSLLADCVEAVIGALFLDQGIDKVTEFIKGNIIAEIPDKIHKPLKDSKSILQEIVQSQSMPTPRYKVVAESGPDHSKKFTVEVRVNGEALGVGEGKSKSIAEQAAAKAALDVLLKKNPNLAKIRKL